MTEIVDDNQTATEYFVTYVPFPTCRTVLFFGEVKGLSKNEIRGCFIPSCYDENVCNNKKLYCHWICNSDKLERSKLDTEHVCKGTYLIKCVRNICPDMDRDSHCSISIGTLPTEALEDYKELLSEILEKIIAKDSGTFFLRSSKDIDGFTPKEKAKHRKAIRRYEEESNNEFLRTNSYIRILKECEETATDIKLEHNIPTPLVAEMGSPHLSPAHIATPDNIKQQSVGEITATKKKFDKGGRQKDKKTLWIEKQYRHGLLPVEILEKWDGMPEEMRKKIDLKKYEPFVNPNITDKDEVRKAREKARDNIEKKRPK